MTNINFSSLTFKLENNTGNADKLKEIMSKGFDCLNNGLSNEQNAILMQSTDVIEIVGLIINGLKNKIGHA